MVRLGLFAGRTGHDATHNRGELICSHAFGKPMRVGRSVVAALDNLRVNRNAAQEWDVHFTGQRLAASHLEQRNHLVAVRAKQSAHVFDDADHGQ